MAESVFKIRIFERELILPMRQVYLIYRLKIRLKKILILHVFIGEVWYSRPRGLIILAVSCKYFIRNFKSYFTSAKKNETPISVRDKFVLSTTSLRHPKYVRPLASVIVSKFKFAIRISIIMTDKYYFRKTKPIIDHKKYLSEVGFEPTPSFEDQNSLILW